MPIGSFKGNIMENQENKKGLSLITKFNLLTILLILVTAGGIIFFVIREEMKSYFEELLHHGLSLSAITAQNSEYCIYTEDQKSLKQIVESTATDPNIAYVLILMNS